MEREREGADGLCRQLKLHVLLLFLHFVPVTRLMLSDICPLLMPLHRQYLISPSCLHFFLIPSPLLPLISTSVFPPLTILSYPSSNTHKTHNLCLLSSLLRSTALSPSLLSLFPSLILPTTPAPPSLNWESGRAVEIALTRALPGCAIHLLFYYAAPGLPGRCRSICHRPRSLITGICHRLASLLMLSSPP